MKYLFFDIECSNSFNKSPKMCEFGYVLVDENFKIIEKDGIPMSPGSKSRENRFDESIYKREPEFQWAYDTDYYFECPEFSEYYPLIKRLFGMKDVVIFGYSVDNDIRYLDNAFQRYELEPVEYKAYDIQKMMKYYSEKKEKFMSLGDAFEKLCSKLERAQYNLDKHFSRDDAFMTMIVLKKMCENLEVTPLEMIELCDNCGFDSKTYLLDYHTRQNEKTEHNPKLKAQALCNDFYKECAKMLENNEATGKIVTLSAKIKKDLNKVETLLNLIKERGFVGINSISGSNYLITLDEEDSKRIRAELKQPYSGTIITIEDFENLKVKVE